jgi:glucosamine kinase
VLGGLADATVPLLSSACRALLQPAKGSALDGALILSAQLTTPSSTSGHSHDA